MTASISPIDWQARVANAFSRTASRYEGRARAQRAIGELLWPSLPAQARCVLDVGCGTGVWTRRLAERYPHAALHGLDIAPGMLAEARKHQRVDIDWHLGDAAALPFQAGGIDLVFSNLALQWCLDLEGVMHELYRTLTLGGQAHITTLLPGTLDEIARAWQRPEALLLLAPLDDIRQAVDASGLRLVSQTQRTLRFFYTDLSAVQASIKGIGAQVGRGQARVTREDIAVAAARFERLREPQGLPVSYRCLILCLEKTP